MAYKSTVVGETKFDWVVGESRCFHFFIFCYLFICVSVCLYLQKSEIEISCLSWKIHGHSEAVIGMIGKIHSLVFPGLRSREQEGTDDDTGRAGSEFFFF